MTNSILDTTYEIRKKQVEIVLSFTPKKRLETGLKMMEEGVVRNRNLMKKLYQNSTEAERTYKIIEAYHGKDLNDEQLSEIKNKLCK